MTERLIGEDLSSEEDTDEGGDMEEEEDPMVAVDRSPDGQFRVVTDPVKIEQIRRHEASRKRDAAKRHRLLLNESWYCPRRSEEASDLVARLSHGVDGFFVVRSSNFRSSAHPDLETFALVMTHGGGALAQFRIIQVVTHCLIIFL